MSRPASLRVFRSALDPGLETIPQGALVYAVLVDVLRATTTLIHAFAHGARSARAFATVADARAAAVGEPDALLCGESNALRPEGFHRGNSPREFGDVAGHDLLVATTNGAPAIRRTAGAEHQFLAAFVNLTAVADVLGAIARRNTGDALEFRLVGAGNSGVPAAEDDALVGALAARLIARGPEEFVFTGEDPRRFCASAGFDPATGILRGDADLETFLRGTEHGQALASLGHAFERDLHDAAQVDAFTRVPFGRGSTIGPGLDREKVPEIPLF